MNATAQLSMDTSPEELARQAVQGVLESQYRREPLVLVDSPPGAGKTWLVERVAAYASGVTGERCMVATQTNAQAFDLVRRLSQSFSQLPVTLFAKKGLEVPDDVEARSNVTLVHRTADLHAGPAIVVANAAKWAWVSAPFPHFDLLVVDEAYQLTYSRFIQIAGLADRYLLVGDPGQIAPVVTCAVERWRSSPDGPHVACPEVLEREHPDLLKLALPVTRRLVPETASILQPAFYPQLPFEALSRHGARRLESEVQGTSLVERSITLACDGASIVQAELPTLVTGEVDADLAEMAVQLCRRLVRGDISAHDGAEVKRLRANMIGIVCAHTSQVNALQERLPLALDGVLVETAERFQGLEREVMIVHHPLSGRTDPTAFHLDAGRLCVMLSRHRTAWFILARQGIRRQLNSHTPQGERVLGIAHDDEYLGWQAHQRVLGALYRSQRVLTN